MFGYVMGFVIVAVGILVGTALMRWARGARPQHFLQFNLAQGFLLLTMSALLGGLLRWWYLTEFVHWGERY